MQSKPMHIIHAPSSLIATNSPCCCWTQIGLWETSSQSSLPAFRSVHRRGSWSWPSSTWREKRLNLLNIKSWCSELSYTWINQKRKSQPQELHDQLGSIGPPAFCWLQKMTHDELVSTVLHLVAPHGFLISCTEHVLLLLSSLDLL